MSHPPRIRTPLKQHWHRFRMGPLPVLAFLLCVVAMLWLWDRQAYKGSVVGEVEALQVDIQAGIDGTLATPEGSYWQRFDEVREGDVVAQLDDKSLQAQLRVVLAEADQLQAQLAAAQADLELNQLSLTQDHAREKMRLIWQYETRRLEKLRLDATIQADIAEGRGIKASLDILENLDRQRAGLVQRTRLIELRANLEALGTRVRENRKVYEEASAQEAVASERLQEFAALVLPNVETVLKPIRAGIQVQEARVEEIQLQIDKLIITTPVGGRITAIHRWPGQRILAGDPILTVASDEARYVISYVREQARIPLYEGMQVSLRLRQPGSPSFATSVETVGPQVEPVPAHQLADQATPEWATPIKIPIPPDLQRENLRPGELVQVIFSPSDVRRRPE